ncbi:MAG: hypothetical protein P4L85_12195 [Paludisphaera borealis]|uniref:hypothetical protein n=1 Tax=Paludisphaera borealis TaxID=1387353 RepID=UPI00284E6141|nr:hypothetical protein [Paludisphaera borealis]MDR3620104.1 hypothetical protein [Paludisphaera borealis]
MAWKEKLYERPLRRPLDDGALEAVRSEYHKRRHEIPVPSELVLHPTKPELMTIKTKWLSLVIQFHQEKLTIDAELSLAAKMMATDQNRKLAVQFIDSIADDLNL